VDPSHAWKAKSTIHAGEPITSLRADPLPDAFRGQNVEIYVEHGSLRIRASGQLMKDAFIGQPVSVLNLSTQTTVTGIYQGDGRVQVGVRP